MAGNLSITGPWDDDFAPNVSVFATVTEVLAAVEEAASVVPGQVHPQLAAAGSVAFFDVESAVRSAELVHSVELPIAPRLIGGNESVWPTAAMHDLLVANGSILPVLVEASAKIEVDGGVFGCRALDGI